MVEHARQPLAGVEGADEYATRQGGSCCPRWCLSSRDLPRLRKPYARGLRRPLLFQDEIHIALPASHHLTQHRTLRLTDREPDEWIQTPVTELGSHLPEVASTHLAAGMRFQGDDVRTVTKLVAAGLGVALLPGLALRETTSTIISRPIAGTPFVRYIYICRLDTTQVPVALQKLERCLINSYK